MRTVDLVLDGNVFVSKGAQNALHVGNKGMDQGRFLASFRSDNNTFWDTDGAPTFLVGPVAPKKADTDEEVDVTGQQKSAKAEPISLEQYRRETGQDKDSRIADPSSKRPKMVTFHRCPADEAAGQLKTRTQRA